ncbi:MAG: ABC transporter C-terminal domain-containing protein, partial [Eubacteriales bacterium]
LEQLERDIEALENDIEAAKAELEKPETASDYVKCAEISQKMDEMNETLLSYYSEWDTLQENTAD